MKKIVAGIAAASVVAGTTGVAMATRQAPAAKQAPAARTVTVNMYEYRFQLVKGSTPIKHGVPITFKTVNKGQLVHNLDFQKIKASKIIPHGQTASITVTFKKAGLYKYICDVPRHAELGMAGTLKVT